MKDAEESFHASHDAIRELQPVSAVQNDGKLLPEETWSEENMKRELAIKGTSEDAAIAAENPRLAREERVSSILIRMPRRTLMDLPNELILLIFDFVQLKIDGLRDLLLVSKRLRQLALMSPRLWARQLLTPSLSPYTIDAIARRSRKLGLQAELYCLPGSNHVIFRDCERWTSLNLHGFRLFEIMRFQSIVPCARLVGLEIMSVVTSGGRFIVLDSDWSLPSLKILECRGVIPLRVQSSVLSECSLEFSDYLQVNPLALSLSGFPCLVRLSINLLQVTGDDGNTSLPITLPALRSFALYADNVKEDFITRLLDTILFPNIEYLETYCSAPQDSSDSGVAVRFETHIRGMRTRYPNLKVVDVSATCMWIDEEEEQAVITFIDILKELPSSVQTLKLYFDNIELRVYDHLIPRIGPWENLRWIGFSKCHVLAPRFFDDLAFLIKRYRMKNLTVDVTRCLVERDEDTERRDEEVEESRSDEGDLLSLVGFIEHEVLQTMRAS